MAVIQLDMFREDDVSILEKRVLEIKASQDRCRKKQFASIGEIRKIVEDLVNRIEAIERGLCR